MSKDEILAFMKANRQEMIDRFGVVKIGLFGSYARGEQTDESDIDIAVELQAENSFRSFFSLKRFLEDHLGKEVDLGIEHTIKPLARERIIKEILYA